MYGKDNKLVVMGWDSNVMKFLSYSEESGVCFSTDSKDSSRIEYNYDTRNEKETACIISNLVDILYNRGPEKDWVVVISLKQINKENLFEFNNKKAYYIVDYDNSELLRNYKKEN